VWKKERKRSQQYTTKSPNQTKVKKKYIKPKNSQSQKVKRHEKVQEHEKAVSPIGQKCFE
jgi:hypothetical protein